MAKFKGKGAKGGGRPPVREYHYSDIIIRGQPEEIKTIRIWLKRRQIPYRKALLFFIEMWERLDKSEQRSIRMKVESRIKNKNFNFKSEDLPLVIRRNGHTIARLKEPFQILEFIRSEMNKYLSGQVSVLFFEEPDIRMLRERIVDIDNDV